MSASGCFAGNWCLERSPPSRQFESVQGVVRHPSSRRGEFLDGTGESEAAPDSLLCQSLLWSVSPFFADEGLGTHYENKDLQRG